MEKVTERILYDGRYYHRITTEHKGGRSCEGCCFDDDFGCQAVSLDCWNDYGETMIIKEIDDE